MVLDLIAYSSVTVHSILYYITFKGKKVHFTTLSNSLSISRYNFVLEKYIFHAFISQGLKYKKWLPTGEYIILKSI
jgi:hypothetical protein